MGFLDDCLTLSPFLGENCPEHNWINCEEMVESSSSRTGGVCLLFCLTLRNLSSCKMYVYNQNHMLGRCTAICKINFNQYISLGVNCFLQYTHTHTDTHRHTHRHRHRHTQTHTHTHTHTHTYTQTLTHWHLEIVSLHHNGKLNQKHSSMICPTQ